MKLSRYLSKALWRKNALTIVYHEDGVATTYQPGIYSYIGSTYTDTCYIGSMSVMDATSFTAFANLVQANPPEYGIGTSGGFMGYQDPMGIGFANDATAYNTLNNASISSSTPYIPEIQYANMPYLVSSHSKVVEFRNNSFGAVWVEMWECVPRRDFPRSIGMRSPNSVGYANFASTEAEYLYRLGIMGNLIGQVTAQRGGGTASFSTAQWESARPGYNINTSVRDCGYYNRWYKTFKFKKFMVQPGGVWTASLTARNKWIDNQKIRGDLFSELAGFTKILMWRIYGTTGYSTATTAPVPSVPTVVSWFKEKAIIKYAPEPRKVRDVFGAPVYASSLAADPTIHEVVQPAVSTVNANLGN